MERMNWRWNSLPRLAMLPVVIAVTLLSHVTLPHPQVWGQVPNSQTTLGFETLATPHVSEAQAALDHGLKLEQNRRWGDALQFYEQAIKEHPQNPTLEERHALVRSHYDVVRRYSDDSYTATLSNMSEHDALRIYGEVLDKVQTHYVTEPNWPLIVKRGTLSFEVALTEEAFVRQHLPTVSAETIAQFRSDFNKVAKDLNPRNAAQARECAAWAGKAATQRLGLASAAVVLEYTCGAASALDEYSSFLTAGQLDEVFSQIEGNFVGLGVELKSEEAALLVVSVIPGGPAALGGLVASDRIIAVDGRNLPELKPDTAADLLRGEEGSTVKLMIRKTDGSEKLLTMTRQRIEVPCVEGTKILDAEQGIGYFKLTSFQKSTSRDVDAALWKLQREGMKSLVMDLRGNPGGLLNAAVELADKFIFDGPIVTTRGRNPREDYSYTAHTVGTWRVPLVVLIDGDSASASEIFAGAIRDRRRGMIVGQRSYGKGSVQGIFPLASSKAGIRLTTAKFFSPSGQAISRQGVTPDVVVRAAARPITDDGRGGLLAPEEDIILKAGLQTARDQLSKR
jgi:carboxyl-terminal processing protease